MNQSMERTQSGRSFVHQKRVDDKKDRDEVNTHSRIFGCCDGHTNGTDDSKAHGRKQSWKTPDNAEDGIRDKYSGKFVANSFETVGEGRKSAGVGPAFDNIENSGPGQRMQSSTEHTTSRLDWPPKETTKGMRRNCDRNFSNF